MTANGSFPQLNVAQTGAARRPHPVNPIRARAAIEFAQPLDGGPDVGQESLDRSLDGWVGGVVGEAPEQVESALGHPAGDVRLAQPSLLDLPRATAQARPVVELRG